MPRLVFLLSPAASFVSKRENFPVDKEDPRTPPLIAYTPSVVNTIR